MPRKSNQPDPFGPSTSIQQKQLVGLDTRGRTLVNATFSRPLTLLMVTLLPGLLFNLLEDRMNEFEEAVAHRLIRDQTKISRIILDKEEEAVNICHSIWVNLSRNEYSLYTLANDSNPDEGIKWFQNYTAMILANRSFFSDSTIHSLKGLSIDLFFMLARYDAKFNEYFTKNSDTESKTPNHTKLKKMNLSDIVTLLDDAYQKIKIDQETPVLDLASTIFYIAKYQAARVIEISFMILSTLASFIAGMAINPALNRSFNYLYRVHQKITGKMGYLSFKNAEEKINTLSLSDARLRYSSKILMAFITISVFSALIHSIRKLNNENKYSPGLYVFILTVLYNMKNFYRLFKEENALLTFGKNLDEIHQFFNQAVSATGTTWTLKDNGSLEDSELSYVAENTNPRIVNKIVKNAFYQNGIHVKSDKDCSTLSATTHFPPKEADAAAINDQLLWKLNKPLKKEEDHTRYSTATTLTQLRKMKGKSTLQAEQKNVLFTETKKREIILPEGVQGKLFIRKNSLLLIVLSDDNPDFTMDDLNALPDRQARAHGQSGPKMLVKGSAHPFWIKNLRTNKREPCDEIESKTVLVNGVPQTVPTCIVKRQVKK